MDLTTKANGLLAQQSIKGRKVTLQDLKKAKLPQSRLGDIYIVCDISGSMSGNKLQSLQHTLMQVYKPGIKVLAFSDDVYELDETDFRSLSTMGGTGLMLALDETWNVSPRHIILITDGEPTDAQPNEIIHEATRHSDIPIDTIGVSEYGRRGYDPDFLRELARVTGGKFTDCGQPIELTAVVQNLLLEASNPKQIKGGTIQL